MPTGKSLPAGTPLRTGVTVEQLSLAVALPSVALLITTPQEVAPAPVVTDTLGGAVTVGGVLSVTVNVVVHVLVLFAASLTVTVIVVIPRPTSVPAAGLCVLVSVPATQSEAFTPPVTSGTAALQLASANALVAAAQLVIVGGVLSRTVTVRVFETVLLLPSLTV